MISSFTFWILLLTGATTSLLALQFLFPRWYSKEFNGLNLESLPDTFYARQAGLGIAVQGVFLLWAAFDENLRFACLTLVGLGKLVLVCYLWANLGKLRGLLVTTLVDTAAVLLFAALLLKL